MADQELGGLVVKIKADASDANAKLDQLVKKTEATSKQMQDSLGELKKVFAEVISVEYIKSIVDYAAHLNTLSQQTGISVEALSQLSYAAKLSGTDIDTLAQAMKIASKNISDAATGTGSAAQSLKDLHLSAKQLSELSPEEQLLAVAAAMQKIGKNADFVAVGIDIFGRGFAQIAPLMRQGADGITELQKAADALGLTITQESAENFNKLTDQIDVLKMKSDALSRTLLENMVPALNDVLSGLTQLLNKTTNTSSFFNTLAVGLYGIGAKVGLVNQSTADAAADIGAENIQTGQDKDSAAQAALRKFKDINSNFTRTNPDDAKKAEEENQLISQYIAKLQAQAALQDSINEKKAGDAAYSQLILSLMGKGLTLEQAQAKIGDARKQQIEDLANSVRLKEENKDIDSQIQKLQDENAVFAEQRDIQAGTAEYYKVVNDLIGKGLTLKEAEAEIGEKRKQELIDLGNIKQANEDAAKAADEYQKTLSDGLTNLATNFKSAGDAAKTFFNTIASNILKASISDPLSKSITNLFTGQGNGIFSSIGSAIGINSSSTSKGMSDSGFSNFLDGLDFSSAHASGGSLNAGSSYLVGENGPEIFSPNVSGAMTPNSRMGGGTTVAFTQVIQVSPGVAELIDAKIRQSAPLIASQAQAGVFNAIRNGGSAAKLIGLRG